MNTELVEWQRHSPINGMIQCWFTHPFLDWAENQDWSDKTIVMFGAGLGDAWLANKCKFLYVVERDQIWAERACSVVKEAGITNIHYIMRPCNDSDGKEDFYVKLVDGVSIDILINDDAYRTEICQLAVDYFKGKEGILICDNWVQSFVWMSPQAEVIMKPFKSLVFEQENHTNNDGVNKWKTAVFYIK